MRVRYAMAARQEALQLLNFEGRCVARWNAAATAGWLSGQTGRDHACGRLQTKPPCRVCEPRCVAQTLLCLPASMQQNHAMAGMLALLRFSKEMQGTANGARTVGRSKL